MNLFAYRGTRPAVLSKVADPVGPANDHTLKLLTSRALLTVAAWGSKGCLRQRSTEVRPLLSSPLCLGTTRRGEPRHPLYGMPVNWLTMVAIGTPPSSRPPRRSASAGNSGTIASATRRSRSGWDSKSYLTNYSVAVWPGRRVNDPVKRQTASISLANDCSSSTMAFIHVGQRSR